MSGPRLSTDDLKRQRDGHLFYGSRDVWRVDRRPAGKPPRWLIERDADGLPCRMLWNGAAVQAFERAHVEVSGHGSRQDIAEGDDQT
jgi:hypothetical protein